MRPVRSSVMKCVSTIVLFNNGSDVAEETKFWASVTSLLNGLARAAAEVTLLFSGERVRHREQVLRGGAQGVERLDHVGELGRRGQLQQRAGVLLEGDVGLLGDDGLAAGFVGHAIAVEAATARRMDGMETLRIDRKVA